jgi:hypothetical protein
MRDVSDAVAIDRWQDAEANDSNIKLIYAKNPEHAKEQILEYQKGEGNTVDNLTFEGHGREGEQRIGGSKTRNSEAHLTADNMEGFYNGIKIEEGGEVRYNGCEVGKGKAGDDFLSSSAKHSRSDSIAHTVTTGWKPGFRNPLTKKHSWSLRRTETDVWGKTVPKDLASKYEKKVEAPRTTESLDTTPEPDPEEETGTTDG